MTELKSEHTSHITGNTKIQNQFGKMPYVMLVITRPGHTVCE